MVVVLEILEVKRLKQQLTQKTENLCPGIQETKLRLPETLGEDREKNVSTKFAVFYLRWCQVQSGEQEAAAAN